MILTLCYRYVFMIHSSYYFSKIYFAIAQMLLAQISSHKNVVGLFSGENKVFCVLVFHIKYVKKEKMKN